jgi:hypothetical protein
MWASSIPLVQELPNHLDPQVSDVAHGPLVQNHKSGYFGSLSIFSVFAGLL